MPYKDPEKRKQAARERSKRYKERHKEKVKEYNDNYNKSEARKISKRKYNTTHRDQNIQYSKTYREINRVKLLEKEKQYREINKEKLIENDKKRFRYKDQVIRHIENPREGICFFCKFEAKTVLHHFEYDDTDPLKYTIEICKSCHSRWHKKFGTPEGYINPNSNKGA